VFSKLFLVQKRGAESSAAVVATARSNSIDCASSSSFDEMPYELDARDTLLISYIVAQSVEKASSEARKRGESFF
jgi:hypothetical protein